MVLVVFFLTHKKSENYDKLYTDLNFATRKDS